MKKLPILPFSGQNRLTVITHLIINMPEYIVSVYMYYKSFLFSGSIIFTRYFKVISMPRNMKKYLQKAREFDIKNASSEWITHCAQSGLTQRYLPSMYRKH